MSVHIIAAGEASAIFGLTWAPLDDPDREKAGARKLFKDFDATHYVRAASNAEILYGLLPADAKQDLAAQGVTLKKAKLVAPAVLLATMQNAHGNVIWAERKGEMAYMSVLENGVPYPGGDYYGRIDDVRAAVDAITAQSNAGGFQFLGDLYPDSIPLSLGDLLNEGDRKAATLAPASRGIDPKLILLAVLLAAIGAGYGYMKWSKEKERAARLAARKVQLDPQKLYEVSLATALSSAGVSVSAAMPAVVQTAIDQEVLEGGWILHDISCEPHSCLYTWNNVGGNNLSLKEALGGRQIRFALDGKSAAYDVSVQQPEIRSLDVLGLPNMQVFTETTGSFSQDVRLLGVEVSFSQPDVFGAPPNVPIGGIRGLVRAGSYSYTGPMALLREIAAELPANMTLGKVIFAADQQQGPRFTLEGKYYVKD